MKYIIIIILLLSTSHCFAQKYGCGFKVGAGFANQYIKNQDIIGTNSIKTFNAGLFGKYYLQHQWLIQGSINIANKGAEITEDAITTTRHITYLDIPVNLVKKVNFPGLGILFVGAGGYAAYALMGRNSYETPNSTTSEKLEFGNDKYLQHYDFGLNATAGLELNNHLLFDLRYGYGLSNLASQPLKDTGTPKIQNRLFTISLGYVIH